MFARIPLLTPLLMAAGSLSAFSADAIPPEHLEFFEKKIRPILADNCYKCHSVEKGKAKGDLTLDSREALRKGGKNGAAVTPGLPEKSLLITAINYADPDLQMPPKGEKLSKEQIADLTTWVKMGAPDPRLPVKGGQKLSGLSDTAKQHWAYQPLKAAPVPKNKNQQWCRTTVDAFVLQKLEANKMIPSPDTDKETLLRRASYDLIGLPPTPQEVESFLTDQTPQAFSKVIDRLLASPHYGERWGRFWLDTARYSDTAGGEKNALRGQDYRFPYAWTYRDYVIESFNQDKPYDQFIIEQLAADKLTPSDPTKLAALGFLTVGEKFRNPNDVINDRIDVVSKGFLGMTVTCARCHDHMFDPIPTTDYYALHGIFASTMEPAEKPLVRETKPQLLQEFQQKIAALEQKNRDVYYKFLETTLKELQGKIGQYLMATPAFGKKGGGTAEEIAARNAGIAEQKLERDFVQLFTRNAKNDRSIFGPFRAFQALSAEEFEAKGAELAAKFAANTEKKPALNPLVAAAFKDSAPLSMVDVTAVYVKLFAQVQSQREAYLAACAKAVTEPVTGFDPDVVALLEAPLEILPTSKLNSVTLRDFVGKLPPQVARRAQFLFAGINELELSDPGAPARAMLVSDTPQPRNSPVFIRGQAENKGPIVPRRFLEILSAGKPLPFKQGSGRLELAQAIASKTNPLTARVMVNRVWLHHFGEGFVTTPDDLGTQSEAPSHPELLDHLSTFFMDSGWSFKKLHKLIMLSRVYQESSRTNPEFETLDPNNRMLWRANIRRLDFEATRDSLLVFSGNMDHTVGGKPINLTDEPYSNRRSVYGYIDRGNLPDIMSNFDFSDPDMPNSKRTTTIVPQQALFLMNSAMSVDVARHVLARKEVANAYDDLSRVFAIYRVLFQRTPKPDEIQLALQFVAKEAAGQQPSQPTTAAALQAANREKQKRKQGQGNNAATRAIQNEGATVERKPLTSWETYAQALLLSNEAAYIN